MFLGNILMMAIGLSLIYLGIKKKYEPLLLVPIGFSAFLANIPYSGLTDVSGFLHIIYDLGIENELFPLLLFIGIGTMIDFSLLIERPWLLIFSAAGQIGIFIALMSALIIGFKPLEAVSIGIIGAMDGPTAIYVTSKYAPHLLGPVSVCAYSYMASIPLLQVPLCKILTTRKERLIRMEYSQTPFSNSLKLIFPIIVTLIVSLIAPAGTPLIGCLMFGNLMKESGVLERLTKSAQNEITNITTLLLGLAIGGTMTAEKFLTIQSLLIFLLGILAFISAIACGILFAKIVNLISKGKVNPMIGSCGISAFPMAARTVHKIGREEDPDNWLIMHAMAANVGGQIASIIAGSIILTYAPFLASL
jgi:oxaloacetate decarboxylase beta subunit